LQHRGGLFFRSRCCASSSYTQSLFHCRYITLCKGNVYQSCGDDEQSLLHYLEGWTAAQHQKDKDWEVICVNAIGMLAYYNLRYDVAILCFHAVVNYRAEVSHAGLLRVVVRVDCELGRGGCLVLCAPRFGGNPAGYSTEIQDCYE
jgi:hypothetical protein